MKKIKEKNKIFFNKYIQFRKRCIEIWKRDLLASTIAVSLTLPILIIFIFMPKTNLNWVKEINAADQYMIEIENCNEKNKLLPKSTLTEISSNWMDLTYKGIWNENIEQCYTTLTITYKIGKEEKHKNILLIDEKTLVLIEDNRKTYYTNAKKIIEYLNILL